MYAEGYSQPVAYIWVHPNGTYEVLDLTTTRGKTSGKFTYDQKNEFIDWTSGDLSKLIGHYFSSVSGQTAIMLNTKKDPEGRMDGTLPCIRIAEK